MKNLSEEKGYTQDYIWNENCELVLEKFKGQFRMVEAINETCKATNSKYGVLALSSCQ